MSYSFFGTCFEDTELLVEGLRSMANQTIIPNEIIIIDSSKKNINLDFYTGIFDGTKTEVKYENIILPRVEALNYAISKASSDYLFRFDTRTRFSRNYAEEALKFLTIENSTNIIGGIGGRQSSYPANESWNAKIASYLMDRAYIFGNPLYRRREYSGKVNSIYLGCYPKKVLKETTFREEISLISEDTQLCQDIIARGYVIYMSKNLQLKYICRKKITDVLKLFRTYGRCRARTIISTRTIHDKKKYFLILIMVFIIPILAFLIFKEKILFSILFILLVPLIYNFFHEIKEYGYGRIFYMPFLGLIAQLNWCLGIIEAFIFFKFIKSNKSNFLK